MFPLGWALVGVVGGKLIPSGLTSISHKLFHVIGIILYFFEPYFLIYVMDNQIILSKPCGWENNRMN